MFSIFINLVTFHSNIFIINYIMGDRCLGLTKSSLLKGPHHDCCNGQRCLLIAAGAVFTTARSPSAHHAGAKHLYNQQTTTLYWCKLRQNISIQAGKLIIYDYVEMQLRYKSNRHVRCMSPYHYQHVCMTLYQAQVIRTFLPQ